MAAQPWQLRGPVQAKSVSLERSEFETQLAAEHPVICSVAPKLPRQN
jgi:hypothetical protein